MLINCEVIHTLSKKFSFDKNDIFLILFIFSAIIILNIKLDEGSGLCVY